MLNLDILSLLDLLPHRITDKEMEALAHALDAEMKEITSAIDEVVIMPRIDKMPEDIVDLLAWQLHVDFYEPLGLNLEKKRLLVQNSILWHMHKGTKYVVEDILRLLFFSDFRIEEWFEYGGRPYFFRAITNNEPMTRQGLGQAIKAIDATKNARSWLDYFLFRYNYHTTQYTATGLSMLIKEYIVCPGDDIASEIYNHDAAVENAEHTRYIITDIQDMNDRTEDIASTALSAFERLYLAEHTDIPTDGADRDATAVFEIRKGEI